MSKTRFASIHPADLAQVSGGARVSSKAAGDDAQAMAMLTQITDSIKGLAGQKPAMDPMMMMVMMMMMGGGKGGGGGAPATAQPPAPPPVPVINVAIRRY